MMLGPIGAIGGLAVQATMRSRGIQIGNAAKEKLKSTDKSSAEYEKLVELVERGGIASAGPTGWVAGKLAKKAEENAAAAKEGEVDPIPTITAKVGSTDITKTSSQTSADAAEKARQEAAFAAASSPVKGRIRDDSGDNGGGGSSGSFGDTITGSGRSQSEIDAGAGGGGYNSSPTGEVSTSKPSSGSTVTERSDDYATGDPGMSGSSSRRGGGGGYSAPEEDRTSYNSSGPFNKGGLINKPKKKSYANGGYVTANEPAKKKKKRKGLGTRP